MDNFWKMGDVRTRQVSNYQRNSEGMFTWSPTFLGDISPGSCWFWFNLVFAPANSFSCFLKPIMFLLVDGCIDDIIMIQYILQYILINFAHSYHSWVQWRSYDSVPICSMEQFPRTKKRARSSTMEHMEAIWEYLYYMIWLYSLLYSLYIFNHIYSL